LFSSHALEQAREKHGALAKFILDGRADGRTRTEISRDYFKGNADKDQISAELVALVHDGTIIEIKRPGKTRPVTRYIHRSLRINGTTKHAAQGRKSSTNDTELQRTISDRSHGSSSEFVDSAEPKTVSNQRNSSTSLVRINGHARLCGCGTDLLPDNTTGMCRECQYEERQRILSERASRVGGHD
jgi:hypothetical protein